ncbi:MULTISPECIES: hemagglutinin repeat-containing protein [unclassified Luteibacter]|uniref:hemagglutinin repeat-containing protein n=1 Tax=Luteibacter sp. PvP019 TaxID=3156436 RepID=UPI00339978A6
MKTSKETTGRPQGARIAGQALLRSVPLAVALAAVGIPVVSWAQVVPDAAAGAHQPKMDSAANGVPVVDIVAPNGAGVSHNKYQRFDVDQRGVILNNSGAISRTQLGGYIAGNDNLKNGEASLILNEVTSSLPSSLRGYVEVGGKAAPVVIANPYGITCDGCGIINSPRFTLTTGTPVFGGSGSLDAFHVTGGSIAIGSGGLDTATIDRTDLIARAVQVNGKIWAKDLSVVAGSNDVGYADASIRAGEATGARTGVAIDVAALGGMYAEKIRLVGTEAGVGVVSSGVIAAQAGDLTLSSAGEVRLGGTTVAMNRLGLDAAGPVTLDGTFGTQTGDVSLTTQGALTLHGSVIAANALSMRTYGDIDQSGRVNAGGNLTLTTSGVLRNSGVVYTAQSFDVSTGAGLHNDGIVYATGSGRASAGGAVETTATSTLHAGNVLSVDAGAVSSLGVMDAGGALAMTSRGDTTLDGAVQAGADLSVQGAGAVANRANVVAGGRLDVQAASIGNEGPGVLSATGALAVTTAGTLVNQGTLYAGGDMSLAAAALSQAATAQIYAGGSVQARVSGDTVNGGSLVGGLGLSVDTHGLVSTGELGTRQGDASLTSATDMTLAGSTVVGGALRTRTAGNLQQAGQLTAGSLDVDAATLSNTGSFYGRGDVAVHTSKDLTNSGSLYGDGSLALNIDVSVVNTGTLHAGADLGVQARTIDSGKQLDAGRDVRLSADTIRTAGTVQAGRDLSLTTRGTLDNDAQVVAGRDLGVNAASVTNTGALSATHDLALTVTGDVANNGKIYAGHGLSVDANALSLGASGAATGADTAVVNLRGDLHNAGNLVAGTSLSVTAASLDSSGSLGSTLGSVRLTSTQGDVRLTGTTSGAGALVVRSAQDLIVDGTLSGASLDMGAARSMALAGSIHAAGLAAFDAAQSLTSTATVYADGDLSLHAGTTLDASGMVHSGTDLSASADALTTRGVLDAGQDLRLQAATTTLGGTLQAGRDVALNATSTLTNGAQAVAGRDVSIEAATVTNDGAISATRTLAMTGSGDLTNNGQISAAEAIDLVLSGAFTNAGRLVAGQGLSITAGSLASSGQLGTLAGDVALSATQGNLILSGKTVSAGGLQATSAGDLTQIGALSAKTLVLGATSGIDLWGSTYSDADATLSAGTSLAVDGTLSAGTQATLSAAQGITVGTAGVVHAGGDIQVDTASIASQGTFDASNDATLNATSIDLAGRVQATRDIHLSGGTLHNASTMVAARDVILGGTQATNLANGAISAQRNLALTVAQDVVNDGVLYAGQLFTLDATRFSQGIQAQTTGQAGLTVGLSGALDSAGSIVGGNGLAIQAGSLRSTGQLGTTQGDVDLATMQGDVTLAGTTVAAGNLRGTSAGALSQTGSLSAMTVDLSSAGDLTLAGDTSSHADMTLGTATALHNSGTVYAGKGLGVHAGGGFDNSGAIGAQEATTLDIGGAFTQTASGTLQGNGALTIVAGSVDSKGVIASAQDLQLTSHGNVALAGTTQAAGMLRIDADGDLANAGKLASGSAMTLTGMRIAQASTGNLSSGGTLVIAARGVLDNQGTLYAGKALTLGASALNQGASAQMYGADTVAIDVAGALQNAGSLVAAKGMDLRAGSVATTGTLGTQQGDMAVLARQGDLTLGGTVSSAGRLDVSTAAALHQSGQLTATTLTLTAQGDLTSDGDIVVQDAALKSGGTLSQNGALGANGITLVGTTVNNSGRTLSSGDLTVRAQTIGVDGVLGAGVKQDGSLGTSGTLHTLADAGLTAHGSLLAGGALDVQAGALDLSNGTQRAGGDATLLARVGDIDHTGGDLAIGGVLTAQTNGKLTNRSANGRTARMQAGQLSLTTGSLDNGAGQLLQTGMATTSIKTAGVLDNTGGTIATNAAGLALRGTRLVNTGGNVQVAGTGVLDINVSQDIDNRQGTLTANGTTQVVAGAGVANDGGLINAHGGTTVSGASLSNTANGAISGSTLDVTVSGAVGNSGGLLQATSGTTHVGAGSLSNVGGAVQAANGAVNLGIVGMLDNRGGTIAAGWAAQLDAASLSNVGGVVSGGTLGLQVGDTVNNSNGLLQSRGNLDLRTANGLTNNAGRIESNGATTFNVGSLANVGGRIANASGQVTQVSTGGAIDNRGGTLGGQGDVNLTASSIGNSQAGTLVAAGNMTLSTGQLDNSNGTAYAGNTFTFTNGGATAYNAGGKITAGRQLNLSLLTMENSGGTVQAGIDGVGGVGNVVLDIRNLVGQGTIVANNTLGMHLVGDYIQAAGSSIKAIGGFNLAVDGQFVNNGSIQAVQGLSISAANITNSAGALLNSSNTQLNTGGTIANDGSIQGDTVGLHAGWVNNTGTIMGGDVMVQAGTVINGADFGTQTTNAAYQSGTIAATRNVDIYTNYLLNRDAQVFSLGNINIAGAGRNGQGKFDTRAGQVDNYSGSIQAQGSILLAANQINNVRRVLQTDSHTLTQAEYDASQPLPRSDYTYAMNKVQEYETWTEYHTISQSTVVAASAQSQIVSGGNISLYGSVNNNTSTIAAAGFLAINQAGAGGGTGMVFGNENVANQSLALGRTIQAVAVNHHMGCGWQQSLCRPGQEKESYTRRPDTDPTHYIHDNYNALPAVMSGSQGVSIGGVNVSNGGVTADGRSVSNARLDPNAQAIGLSTANKGGAEAGGGIAIGAQVDPATGHAPQVLGGAGQPLAGVTLPTGGIYSVRAAGAGQSVTVDGGTSSAPLTGGSGGNTVTVDGPTGDNLVRSTGGGQRVAVGGVDAGVLSAAASGASARSVGSMGSAYLTALLGHAPSSNYLIETNARFADYSQFISSDYLLDHLGVDPARTMMRLGDGFYEQQLVTQQVTQLTGRAYLSNYASGLAEYQALMNNASNVSRAMSLSVGVALTADQVSSLTQDIVWLVQQNVQGHEVLVPVVYLAGGSLGLTAQGAVIAGKDVSIDASGTLANDGLIRGQNSAVLSAQNLLNSGRISSDGLTALSASKDIVNTNGRIDGAGVALVAGGDIRSENLTGLGVRGLAGSSITATQGLQISAGHDLSLTNTLVSSGGNALLTAGHDLSLSGHGVSAGGSLGLMAGNNLSLSSTVTTETPYRWSSITTTRADGIGLSAGGNLSLVAGNDMTLSGSTLRAGGDAMLQAGHDLTLGAVQTGNRWNTQTLATQIDAGGSLGLSAGHDLNAQAATLKSGADTALLAGHDLSLTAAANGNANHVTHQVTTLDAGGNLSIAAGNDASLQGTQLTAGKAVGLQAGNDLILATVTDSTSQTSSWKEGKKRITQTTTDDTVRGVAVNAGTGVQMVAGHDLTLQAAEVKTAGDIVLGAGHDLSLATADETHTVVTDTKKKKSGLLSSKTTTTHDETSKTLAVGTNLDGDNVRLVAGNDLNATAASVTAKEAIGLSAGHDVNLLTGDDVYDESHSKTTKRSGMTRGLMPADYNYQTQTRANADVSEDHVAIGTLLSGDTVTVSAGHDLTTQAAQVAGTHDVTLAAGNDLNIGTAVSTHAEGHKQSVSTSGFIQNGLSVTIGNQKTKNTLEVTQVDATGSMVGSTDGKVTMAAGKDVHITGSTILSQTGTTIVGQNVTIDAGLGTLDTKQTQSVHSGGINVGLTGGMASAAQGAYESAHRGGQADDDRLKALYAMQAGYGIVDTVKGAGAAVAGAQGKAAGGNVPDADGNTASGAEGAAKASGVSLRIGLGASTANSRATTHDDTTAGSTLRSSGDITIAATNGDLNVIGSQVDGKNVNLAATHDLNLLSQLETHTQKSSSANASGEVGFSVGSQTGIYVTASVGKGIAHGNGTTNANTSVSATDKLSLIAGNDANILGAQAKGETVVAAIGGDLNMASHQATNDYASQYWQVGGTFVYGYGSQVSVAVGKTTSNYTSVDQISGIGAGKGGYDIYVGGNTDLKGAVIASSADASKNTLSTGSLTFSDLQNKAEYHSFSASVSGGGGGFSGNMSVPQSKDSSSTTKAGIAEGTIDVREQPRRDLSGLDRNPDIDAGGLKTIFDQKKVAERQEMGQVAGYVGMRSVGELGEYMEQRAATDADKAAWSDGGRDKVLLHGLVGAATAALGGGNAVGGALGAGTSEAMSAYLVSHAINPNSDEGKTLMQLASIAVGTAAGGGSGASTALDGERFNRELHPDEKARIAELAGKDDVKLARLTAAACYLVQCYAEYPVDSAQYVDLKKEADYGATLTNEVDQLSHQTQSVFISTVGYQGYTEKKLFDYGLGDKVNDYASQVNGTYQLGTRAGGAVQMVGGAAGAAGSLAFGATTCETIVGCVAAGAMGTASVDQAAAGANTLWYGTPTSTLGSQVLQKTGLSPEMSELVYGALQLAPAAVDAYIVNNVAKAQTAANEAARETYQIPWSSPSVESVWINSSTVRQSQNSVSYAKSGGYTLDDIYRGLVENPSDPRLTIDAVTMNDGILTSLDNSRPAALNANGSGRILVRVRDFDELLTPEQVDRFTVVRGGEVRTPTTWGEAIDARIWKQGDPFMTTYPNGSHEIPKITGAPADSIWSQFNQYPWKR